MTTQEKLIRRAELETMLDNAKTERKMNNTPETRAAYRDAWNALNAFCCEHFPRPKRGGYASRAGQRQAAERRAMHGGRR